MPPRNRHSLWLPLHCAAARQEASLRFVPRQPNPQRKEQHQENSRSSLSSAFSPFCSLIKGTRLVSEMLARRGSSPPRPTINHQCLCGYSHFCLSLDFPTNPSSHPFFNFPHPLNPCSSATASTHS